MVEYKFKVKYKILKTGEEKETGCVVNFDKIPRDSGDVYISCIARLSELLDLTIVEIESITLRNKIDCKNRSLFSVDSLKDICNWHKKTESGIIDYVTNDNKQTEYTTVYKVNDNIPIFYIVKIPYQLPTVDPLGTHSLTNTILSDKYQHIICIGRYMVEYDDYIKLSEYQDTPETSLWNLQIYNNRYGFYDAEIKLSIYEIEKILLSEYDMLSNISKEDYIHEDIINYPDIYLSKMGLI